jgi:hypothetical protein
LKPVLKILTSCYLLIIFLPVYSQIGLKETAEGLKGIIVNEHTFEYVSLVHIYNERTHRTTVSDTSGYFSVRVSRGDTLVFSAIGYFLKAVCITDSMLQEESVFVELLPREYEIPEARVYALGTYEQFKQKVLALKLPETRTDKLRKSLYDISRQTGKEVKYQQDMDKLARGVLYSIPILSPEEIEMIKLKKIKEKEKINNIIYEKFNPEIVGDLTGLEGDELIEFMVFCNFSEKYLLETNQYYILVRVLEKLEEFKKLKKSNLYLNYEKYEFS